MNNIQMNNGNAGLAGLLELFSQQGQSSMPQVFIPPASSQNQSGFQDILNKASFEKPRESSRKNEEFLTRKEDFLVSKKEHWKDEKIDSRKAKPDNLQNNDKPEIPRSKIERKSNTKNKEIVEEDTKVEQKEHYEDKDQGSVLQIVASVLGISMKDLIKTMKDANMEPKELTQGFDFQEIKSALEELLPNDQKDTASVDKMLIKLLSQASNEKTSESVGDENQMMDKLLQGEINKGEKSEFPEFESNINENQEDGSEKLKEVADTMKFLGHKIREFKENVLNTLNEQAPEVSKSIQGELKDVFSTEKVIESIEESDFPQDNSTEDETIDEVSGKNLMDTDGEGQLFQENESGEESDLKDNKQSQNYLRQDLNNDSSEKGQNFNSNTHGKGSENQGKQNESSNINGIINSSEVSKLNRTSSVTKTNLEQQTLKDTIVKQIVSSAKVTLANGKSEMKLELRPEHLGKLSMKIVTEQGKVMAKIFADSHQVKEIIETNLNTLKESLESQGVKVEGFTVDVGQNKERQFKERNQDVNQGKKGKSNLKEKIGIKSINSSNYGGYDHHDDRLNRYYGGQEESINLTA